MLLGLDDHFFKFVLPLVVTEIFLWHYAFASDLRTMQVVLGLVGLWWCFAALWVEVKIAQVYGHDFDYENPPDPKMEAYKPFCDFAPWANCSKVLMSPPGRFLRYFGVAKQGGGPGLVDWVRGMIDVPNPTLGVAFFGCHLFYPLLLLLPIPFLPQLFFLACCFVGCMTIWLAYNLFFVLKDFCVVCVSMYVANFALIPMMYGMCPLASFDDFKFFGEVPALCLWPFLILDAFMGVAVLKLWLTGPAHAREPAWLSIEDPASEYYQPMTGSWDRF